MTPRPGTLVSTRAVDANPTVYVVGTSGELYGFARPAQLSSPASTRPWSSPCPASAA